MCLSAVLYRANGEKEDDEAPILIPCHLFGTFHTNQFHSELRECIHGQETPIIAERMGEILDWLYTGHYVKRTRQQLEAQKHLFESLISLYELCTENSGYIELE